MSWIDLASPLPVTIQRNQTFIGGINHCINWDHDGKFAINEDYSIDSHHSIFVQNAEAHTHGFNSADLGLGSYRNAMIINQALLHELFPKAEAETFQKFEGIKQSL